MMVPLAVSGLAAISVVVAGAVLLLYVLFRGEREYVEEPVEPSPQDSDQDGPEPSPSPAADSPPDA